MSPRTAVVTQAETAGNGLPTHLAFRPGLARGHADVHVLPHPNLRRAVAFDNVVELRRAEETALADSLDGMAAGFFLVDGLRRLVHVNASGRAMLHRGDVLHMIGEKLAPVDREARKTFVKNFADTQPDAGMGAIKAAAMPLAARDGERWMAYIRPLTRGTEREATTAHAAAAAIFVRKVALDFISSLETLAETFRLTPAEARVLGAIMECGAVPEASRALQLSETTVKTHLRHIFEKTGTRRQTDLIKLAACFANPLGM